MKKLSEVKWCPFPIEDIFTVSPGIRLTKDAMVEGNRPFIGASDSNNGITAFCGNTNKSLDSNVLGVNYNGSVVENFYHPYEAIFSDDVKRLHLKEHVGNKYIYLFIKNIILKQKEKFQYGYKFNGDRMLRTSIKLPIGSDGKPDFDFMEQYMKAIEKKLLKRYQQYLVDTKRNTMIDKKLTGCKIEWKEFDFVEIFEIKKGFYNKKPPHRQNGNVPFIGATESNNGITSFTTIEDIKSHSKTGAMPNEPFERKYFKGNCICVTNNGSVGNAYYQDTEFTCTHDVNPLYLKDRMLTRHLAMYIIACIEKQKSCFEYARKWRPCRMVKSRLMLPVSADGNPDYEYMEQYMKAIEHRLINRYIEKRLKTL